MRYMLLQPNPHRDTGLAVTLEAADILHELSVDTILPEKLAANVALPDYIRVLPFDEAYLSAEMILCLGGDGTILHTARKAARHKIPILGVNLGNLGFMSELERDELAQLRQVVQGSYCLDRRMMLLLTVRRNGAVIHEALALNDGVVAGGSAARVVEMSIAADSREIAKLTGDGVILATPTGSTAYSLSAGGPIVEPSANSVTVTPICAHALYAKSFVLSPTRTVSVTLGARDDRAGFLSVDGGDAFPLRPLDVVTACRAEQETLLVRLKEYDFYQILHSKLR